MPRSNRRVADSPELRALDEARRVYDHTEAIQQRQLAELKLAAVLAVLKGGLTRAEAARRAGYTREYMSRLVSDHLREHPEDAPPSADASA